jgi:GNAT superfamily N-acetyltransferase
MAEPEHVDPSAAITLVDKLGEPFRVQPFALPQRPALEEFYGRFQPPRAAQGLPPQGVLRIARWLDAILPTGAHLVAYRDLRLIGHAFVVPYLAPDIGEYAVFLEQTERSKGIGTQLNCAAIRFARNAGFAKLWLSVEPHNRAAIRSYERAGFQFVAGTRFSPEIEMTLDLGE